MTLHDDDKHFLLAPHDVPRHLKEDHGDPTPLDEISAEYYLDELGVPPHDTRALDVAVATHSRIHEREG